MNRKIKFRAWDKKEERMFIPHNIDTIGILTVAKHSDGSGILNENDIEIMQYTGLKDKNGKEIYEGDILRNGQRVFDVHYCDSIAQFEHGGKSFVDIDASKTEIIGNIYENPELLDK